MSYSIVKLRSALLEAGERPVLYDMAGQSLSGAELLGHVGQLAGALEARVGRGARVGLWYRNGFAAVEAFVAVEWLGGTRVPVDPEATAEEAAATFADAGCGLVLTDAERSGLVRDALVHDYGERLAGQPVGPEVDVPPERIFMLYPRAVSGGRLQAVPLTYSNWAAIIDTNIALYRSGRYGRWKAESEVFLACQQIMHGTGFLGTFPFLAMGLPQVLVDRFAPSSVAKAALRHRATGAMLVPAMLRGLIDAAEAMADDFAFRHVLYGGGPSEPADIVRAVRRFGPVLTQVYGRVEGGWPLAMLGPDDHSMVPDRPELARFMGRPIAEVEVRLRPTEQEKGDSGELLIRSPMASPDFVNQDGWCALGDVVARDPEGRLRFLRRLDRMINTGYHVYPEEIEAALAEIQGVVEARVDGEPHPRWGKMLVAFVVPTPGSDPAVLVERMTAELTRRLAKYKVPREFRLVERL